MQPVRTSKYKRFGILIAGCLGVVAGNLSAETIDFDAAEALNLPTQTPNFVNTADFVTPSASEVIADVQSVFFAPRFQTGEINGHRYVLFANGTARVYDSNDRRSVLSNIRCQQAIACQIAHQDGTQSEVRATGGPQPGLTDRIIGKEVAIHLAEWMLADSGTPEVEVVSPSEVIAPVATEAVEPIDAPLRLTERPTNPVPASAQQSSLPVSAARSPKARAPAASDVVDAPRPADTPVDLRRTSRAPVVRREPALPATQSSSPIIANDPVPLSFAERYQLKCSVTGSATLTYENDAGGTQIGGKPRVSAGCSANLTEQLSLRVSMIRYLVPGQQEDHDAEFTYALNYKVNDTVSLSYSNYSGSLSGPDGGFFNALADGNLRASFRLPKLTLPNDKSVSCSASVNLPNPTASSANLSCGYSITPKLRVSGTANIYFPGNQGEFDPDFSYTASYRVSDTWRLTFSNYGNNRWPWNPSDSPGRGFTGGTLSATYSIDF